MYLFIVLHFLAAISLLETVHASSWSFLKEGDEIEIIAPSSQCTLEVLNKAKTQIAQLGFKPKVPDDIFSSPPHPLGYSNTEEYRLSHFLSAFNDPSSKAVWALRGGFGASALLPKLEACPKPAIAKPLIGFSDITALHCLVNQKWQMPSIHGAMLAFNKEVNPAVNKQESLSTLAAILKGEVQEMRYEFEPLNQAARSQEILEGSIIGGNLALVQDSIGTSTQIMGKNNFIFLEDTHEMPARLERVLNHLLRANIFKGARGVLLGNLSTIKEENYKLVMKRFAEEVQLPVLFSHEFGHGDYNRPLPLGTPATLQLGKEPLLTVKTNIS